MEEPQCAARDTSVEGRLGDLENTVRNHLVVYDRLMQSTERAFDKLLKRIDALERRADVLEGYCAACKAHDGVCERLQALEARLSDPPTWKTFEAALKRIEALEEFRRSVSDE